METTQSIGKIKIFKYNALLSAVIFLMSSFYIGFTIPNYSFSKYTISSMSRFLDDRGLSFFNSLFFLKFFLDLSFTLYFFKFYQLKLKTFTAINWIIAIMTFGLLGFFPTHLYKEIHITIVYFMFFSWTISEYTLARLTKNDGFIYFSSNLILIQFVMAVLAIVFNYFNAISETAYFLTLFLWLIIFIGRFLKEDKLLINTSEEKIK